MIDLNLPAEYMLFFYSLIIHTNFTYEKLFSRDFQLKSKK